MSGAYEIIPKEEMRKRTYERRKKNGEKDLKFENIKHYYDWYIDAPPGRSSIAIHGGRNWENIEGCFIPGDTIELSADGKDFNICGKGKKKELFDFFKQYGQAGIKINVGPHFEELYE